MIPTVSGLITLAGLLAAFFYVVWPSNKHAKHIHVVQAWWLLFGFFLFATAVYTMRVSADALVAWYGLPTAMALAWFCWAFRDKRTPAAIILAAIFLINPIGTWLEVYQWKIASIDILDVLVWAQIAALVQLARENPDPVLSRTFKEKLSTKDNILRMVGYVGQRRHQRNTT